MIVAIDSRPLFFPPKQRSGARRWNTNLIRAIADLKTSDTFYMLCRKGEGRLLDELNLGDNFIPVELSSYGDYSCYSQSIEQTAIRRELKDLDFDIYVGLYFIIPLKRKFRALSVFDDMIPWIVMGGGDKLIPANHGIDNEMKGAQIWKRASAASADCVISVSESTRRDLLKFWGGKPDAHKVVYESIDPAFQFRDRQTLKDFRHKYQLPDEYILFVSTIEARKNVKGLINAYADYRKRVKKPLDLVLVGPKGSSYDEVFSEPVRTNSLENDVITFSDYVPSEDLPYFYNCATLFCFPSFYEGFGLTLLEALSSGLPVITSNISSLPEVAGDAALYVDPGDSGSIADRMVEFSENPQLRTEYSSRALKQADTFSFRKTAETFMKVVSEAADLPDSSGVAQHRGYFKPYEGSSKFLILGTASEDVIESAVKDISDEIDGADITVLIQKGRTLENSSIKCEALLPAGFFRLFEVRMELLRYIRRSQADTMVLLYNNSSGEGYNQYELFTILAGVKKIRGFFNGRRVVPLGMGHTLKKVWYYMVHGCYDRLWKLRLRKYILEQQKLERR